MITTPIRNMIAGAGLGLVEGSTLFSEGSKGDQYVSFYTTTENPWPGMGSGFRKAYVQTMVVGYTIADGKAMAESILELVEGMIGDYAASDGKTYHIYAVSVISTPTILQGLPSIAYSSNAIVYYRMA